VAVLQRVRGVGVPEPARRYPALAGREPHPRRRGPHEAPGLRLVERAAAPPTREHRRVPVARAAIGVVTDAADRRGARQGQQRPPGRFEDQVRSFSCLGVLHNAVVAWDLLHPGEVVARLRAEGQAVEDATLASTTPLLRKHLNPFGRSQFDLERRRQTLR
jgi:Tn3 transposase DDE domain